MDLTIYGMQLCLDASSGIRTMRTSRSYDMHIQGPYFEVLTLNVCEALDDK